MLSDNYRKKLLLGTVQFGLDYGISNTEGEVTDEELNNILNFAHTNGIKMLDTSIAYGNSEERIGRYQKSSINDFGIITKIPPNKIFEIKNAITNSIEKLAIEKLEGVLFHDFESFRQNPLSINNLLNLKKEGLVRKVGFSLYYPEQLYYIFENNLETDIIQIPYNLLDRRFESLFPQIKNKGIEIHTRSTFLQGLFFMDNVPDYFGPIEKKIEKIKLLALENSLSIESLCLNFSLLCNYIDKVLIGVVNTKELKKNIDSLKDIDQINKIMPQLLELKENNEQMILPIHWKI